MICDYPLTDVVIVNWNGERFLDSCLSSLSEQTYPNYDVIVVDNASTDGSVELIKRKFSWVKLITLAENTEFAKGNNIGFKKCNGKYVIVLNADTSVPHNFIDEFVKVAELDERIGAAGCRINTRGSFIRYASVFFNNGLISGPPEESVLSRSVYCLAPCGAAVIYRKTLLDELGGFDEDFITNWEDHDLGFRIYLSGHVCVHIPNVTIEHYGGGAYGEKLNPNRIRIMTRNKFMTYFKNIESKRLLWTMFMATVYETGANIIGENRSPITFIKAMIEFTKFAIKSIDKRKNIQSKRKVKDVEILRLTNGYVPNVPCKLAEKQR